MRATEKFYNEMNKINSTNWLNIVMGNQCGQITEDDIMNYGVKEATFRAQLRDDFYTAKSGITLYFATRKDVLYN